MQSSSQNTKKEEVREEKYKNLGKHTVQSSTTVNPIKNVDVKLRTAAGHTVLTVPDAFSGFADQNFDLDNQLVKSPESFAYNKVGPKAIQGFPGEKLQGLDNWYTQAGGNESEEKVFNQLGKTLKAPGLILNGLEVKDTLKVLKQNIQEDVNNIITNNKHLLGHEVTPDEWGLAAMLNIDKANVETEANEAFNALCKNMNDHVLDFNSIESNYVKISERDKKKHKGIYSNLKEEFEKQVTVYNRDPRLEEIRNYVTRKYYKKELDRNQEFDFLCAEKLPKALIHVEVKSYPQKGSINSKGLKKVFVEACEQINKGKDFIENILAPSTGLTTEWTRVSFVWFPQIADKKPFEDLNIKKDYLKYILTGEDIGSDQWWISLGVGPVGIDDGSYKRLFSFLIGSAHVSVNSQVYDWSKDRIEVNERLVGATGLGLGGEMLPEAEPQSRHLKGKPLGHSYNIIFWNPDQKILQKRKGHNVLVGDYGGGKSSLLVSMGLREAEDPANTVAFISAAAVDPMTGKTTLIYPVFDEALELKFEGTGVQVFSAHSLIQRYGLPQNASFPIILQDFLSEFGGPKLVLLMDEASIAQKDLRQIARQEESDLSKMCQMIAKNSKTSWIALSSSALLEQDSVTSCCGCFSIPCKKAYNYLVGVGSLDISKLETYFKTHTQHTIAPLTKTMRNTNHIVGGAENVSKYVTTFNKIFSQLRNVITPGASHTVPGDKPDLVLCEFDNWSNVEASIQFVLTDLLKLSQHRQGQQPYPPINERVVVLCDGQWRPSRVSAAMKKLTGWGDDVIWCYDSGVRWRMDIFSGGWLRDSASPVDLDDQRQAIRSFLRASSGVLVTYDQLFSGMENAIIVYIVRSLGGAGTGVGGGVRSGMLRACSKLIMVANRTSVNKDVSSQEFNIHDPDRDIFCSQMLYLCLGTS